ncbi:MAG: RluA family pseudouridine synthase [Anaerococcus sp.]|nr:RluA family pseudouridine synthase [Anaerococcus sp.]
MIEVEINENDGNQRFDRFLRKYLENAPLSLIQKNIRKKNFKINDKRAKNDDFIYPGDKVTMYIKDRDFKKWVRKTDFTPRDFDLDVIYEDKNLLIMDKKKGTLTHAASKKDYGDNLLDNMINYLYKTNFLSKRDKTFRPAVVNRLDRNTEGLVIGGKNAKALRALNKAIRQGDIDKYYLTLVKGEVKREFFIETKIDKNENKNRIKSSRDGKQIKTFFRPLETNGSFSLVECMLYTGKTHQIRFSLKKNKTPIIGDRKYGDWKVNQELKKIGVDNQVLLAYKLVFGKIKGLEYLEGKEFLSNKTDQIYKLKDDIFRLEQK